MSIRVGLVAFVAAILALDAMGAIGTAHANKARRYNADPPIKDCTRINGRWGYYGNFWCTPAEQLRWDRWQARRR
jgi:hypothetical protein